MKHRLEYWLIAAVTHAVRLLPWSLVRAGGVFMGLAVYFLDPPHRRITLANLEAAFPVRSAADRRRTARGVFAHFGRVLLELLKFSTLTPEQMLERVEFEGDERARQAYALGRGVLFFTGHFGYWELCGIVHALKIGPIGVLARALDNPHLNRLLEQARQSTGNTVIYRRGALRRVMRALEANQGVAMLIDQHTFGPDAVYVDFFNRPAATTSSLAALAIRTGAPAIPVFAIPLPDCRYRMIYEHPVVPPAPGSPDAIREFTQRCTDVLEMYVRRYPDLWLWMHRRWRDGEPVEQAGDMFSASDGDAGTDPVGIDD